VQKARIGKTLAKSKERNEVANGTMEKARMPRRQGPDGDSGESAALYMIGNREMIFISHASPEDNEFTRWLTLQLAREGFPVWCDLTRLLGGEDFWRDIEDAIRNRTIKFIYVLSTTSNVKEGPRKELAVAQMVGKQLKDFVIPLKIDQLPHDDTNIELQRLNALDFSKSWASGLAALLRCLNEARIPRKQNFNPDAVATWWKNNFGADVGISPVTDMYLSNWYEIEALPRVYLHFIQGDVELAKKSLDSVFPVFEFSNAFLSFASAQSLESSFRKSGLSIARTNNYDGTDFASGNIDAMPEKDARNAVRFLLRASWEAEMLRRGLSCYQLARNCRCFWFRKGQIPKDVVPFIGVNGKRTDRQLVGRFKGLQWHFAIQARSMLFPFHGFAFRTHIVFTTDGITPLLSASQQHSARRSLGKNWWTPHWRDRLTAIMTQLSAATVGFVEITVSDSLTMRMRSQPNIFESPVSYTVIEDQPPEHLPDDEDNEEEVLPNEQIDSVC